MSKQKEEEEKKDRKAILLAERKKTIYNLMLLGAAAFVVLIGILTMAWFVNNTKVNSTNMSVTVDNKGFELQVAGVADETDSIGYYSLYDKISPKPLNSTDIITSDQLNGQVIAWRMENGDDELKPGSQGELRFTVVSRSGDTPSLLYGLSITAFKATTHVENPGTASQSIVVDSLADLADSADADQINALKYINTHVLYFTGRSGNAETGYQYFGFISNKESFELVLDNNNQGVIYWIWPKTLGQIALKNSDTGYIKGQAVLDIQSSTYTTDRTALTNYVKEKKDVFFSGTENYASLLDTMYSKRNGEPAQEYKEEFNKLSAGYNKADQIIGKNIDYVLIQMTASQ